ERPLNGATNTFIKLASFQSTTVAGCDDGRNGQSVLEPITNVPTLATINMFDKLKGGNPQDPSNIKVLASPQPPFSPPQTPGIVDSFNVIQPSTTTQATRRGTLDSFPSGSSRIINPVSSRHPAG